MNNFERWESRQSQVLHISEWLYDASDETVIEFLHHVKNEFGHSTLGGLVASSLIQNQSQIPNQCINRLLNYCTNHKNISNIPKITNNDSNKSIDYHLDIFCLFEVFKPFCLLFILLIVDLRTSFTSPTMAKSTFIILLIEEGSISI